MESFFSRYKNPLVLMAVLFLQVIILASSVPRADPRSPNAGHVMLIRVWTINAITPMERMLVGTGHFFRNGWRNYVNLIDTRKQNVELQAEVNRLRLEQVRYKEAVSETQRLETLLGFKERFISKTIAAQIIGSSGSEQSRLVIIDRGYPAGLKSDMAVITPDGIVGKVKEVYRFGSQVLLITDRDSGAGVILGKSRLQGVLRGTSRGELVVDGIMADEKIAPGEEVITSGGDRIYPKGIPVGKVISAVPDPDNPSPFLAIKVQPAADLSRLEEVLVVTQIADQSLPGDEPAGRPRAADLLGERLPRVPQTEPKADSPKAGSMTPPNTVKAPQPSQPLVGAGSPGAPATPKKTGKVAPGPSSLGPENGTGGVVSGAAPGVKPAGTAPALVPPTGQPATPGRKKSPPQPPGSPKPQGLSPSGARREALPEGKKPEEPKPEPPPQTLPRPASQPREIPLP